MVSTLKWKLLVGSSIGIMPIRSECLGSHLGDIKKVAACKVKPIQLVDRESIKDSNSKEVILEDGLEDVKNLLDQEEL